MSSEDTRPGAVTLADLTAYLKATGWLENPPGRAGVLWERPALRAGLPLGDDPGLVLAAVGYVAQAEGRTADEVAAAILAHGAEADAEPPAVTSPAPVPAGAAATATEPEKGNDGGASSPPVAASREALGRLVHETRLAHNAERERPFGLLPWEERDARQQELDRRIGEAVAAAERERIAALLDDLASASGGPSHFAYRNAAHLIRQERTDEKGPTP